jgi:hypothetical protein
MDIIEASAKVNMVTFSSLSQLPWIWASSCSVIPANRFPRYFLFYFAANRRSTCHHQIILPHRFQPRVEPDAHVEPRGGMKLVVVI